VQTEFRQFLLSFGAEYFVFSLQYKNSKIKTYSIILPVVLCGCETWSLTLREERRLRVSENRVLRRIFGAERDEVTGECRKQHNEELNDFYWSPNIVRVIKSRMRWAGHVTRMGEGRVHTGFWWGDVIEREELGLDGTVIIKWIFKKWDGDTMTVSSWLSIGKGGGSYECGNETLGSIKFEEFLD